MSEKKFLVLLSVQLNFSILSGKSRRTQYCIVNIVKYLLKALCERINDLIRKKKLLI